MDGGYIFKWMEKTFQVSDSEILTYSGLSTSHTYNTKEKKNGKKMPKSKDVGPGIGKLNFSVKLSALQGNNVKEEHDWWVDECEKGTYSYIYMGGAKFGNYKWRLKQVDVKDLVTINDGTLWKSCTLSISFEEYYVKVRKTKAEKKAERLQKKMRRQMERAETAKSDKARAKAALKTANYKVKYEDQKVVVAKEKAKKAENAAKANVLINQYYDQIRGGESYKLLKRKQREELKKMGKS